MADISSTATVRLNINGKDAEDEIKKLNDRVSDLRKKMNECVLNGDTKGAQRMQRQIERTERQIRRLTDAQSDFNHTLNNLNTASIKDLRNTLSKLESEFGKLDRGSDAWKKHAELIRRVKQELHAANSAVQVVSTNSKSLTERAVDWFNKWQVAVMGVAATVTGLVTAARSAVKNFADMDQEMANVRKFTGMTAEEVGILNESFKKIDTRSSREDLNKLAQEAGRLGKSSQEDVLGFVRAADKINVALDDLGDGATLTLSKLTGIFGDEKRLGTEKSLLSVGSVINELSQNCSASAPYIAEFASRMGGVGAQAGLTVQQIMAFAAVLDTNNQKLEASATALSQVIVRIYQDPAKYARVAGMDVKKFSDLVKTDMNAALIEFLSTLKQAGNMDVLSPMFKDMGENGSRAISALSTLANHIEDVKNQQIVANEAFAEATSINTEFDVQNTTVQAGLEKAKKRIAEISIELGEKLAPVMRHVISSTSIMLRVLSAMVSFISNNTSAVLALCSAYGAYVAVTSAALIKKQALLLVEKAGISLAAAKRSAILLLSAAKALLTGNISKATAAMRAFNASLAISPVGVLAAALAGLTAWMISLRKKTDECSKSMKDSMASALSFAEALQKEKSEIDQLFGALDGAKKGTEEYQKAKDAIISRYGAYLTGLINEKGEIINLAAAYDRLTWAAQRSAQARSIANARENINNEYIQDIDKKIEKMRKALFDMGVPERKVSEVVSKVAAFFGSNGDTSSQEWKNIFAEVSSLQKKYQGRMTMPWESDATAILGQMRDNTREHNVHLKTLEDMEGRRLRHLDNESISNTIDVLQKQLKESPKDLIEVSIPAGTMQNAQTIANMITTGTKIVPAEKGKKSEQTNPFALQGAKNPDGSFSSSAMSAVKSAAEKSSPREANINFSFHRFPMMNAGTMDGTISRAQAENLLRELLFESEQRGLGKSAEPQMAEGLSPSIPYYSSKEAEKERKKREAEARRAAAKQKKEFKDELNSVKGVWEAGDATNIAEKSHGLKSWTQFLEKKFELQKTFLEDSMKVYEKYNLQEDEDYQELLKKKEQLTADWLKRRAALAVQDAQQRQKNDEMQAQLDFATPSSAIFQNEEALQIRLHDIRIKYLEKMRAAYNKDSEEYMKYSLQIKETEQAEKLRIQKKFAQMYMQYSVEYQMKSTKEKYSSLLNQSMMTRIWCTFL